MAILEPNINALLWFSLFWTLCCIGMLILSGSYPLATLRERGHASSMPLAILNGLLMLVFAAATVFYGYSELRVTTLIIVMGLAFLFTPATYEIWPERWRDGKAILAILLVLLVGAIAVLFRVGAYVFATVA